ncbi:hypothetical protein BS78_01G309200 [Paspalum vaginatum]|nr:hypothetical protein BS78_01G309200 [Paspalum vaginatum]
MPNTVTPSGRHGGGRRRRRWRDLTRADLLTFVLAATLCSASYCLAIWHNGRGAADSRVLGPNGTAAVVVSSDCRGHARLGAADTDEPLDFEAHHTAESAGLSVSTSAAATRMARARRALRPGRGASALGPEAIAAGER